MTELCSVVSRELGEPIAGTAVARTSVWIVLEHRGAWGAKAVPESDLPEAVKQRLMAWGDSVEGARVQLVRRSGRTEGPLRLFLGVSDLGSSRLVEWTLESAEDLLGLDVPAAVTALRKGEAIEGARERTEPLMLVCTNGRRDVCCSKQGIPVVKALCDLPGVEVWQTTHLGGHRFAATLLQLPVGLCYGRVEPGEAVGLAQAAVDGTVYRLDRLRGRTALHGVEQAAETIWRGRNGRLEVDALAHAEHTEQDGVWVVTLRDREGEQHEVRLQRRELGPVAPPSCGKDPVPVAGWFVA